LVFHLTTLTTGIQNTGQKLAFKILPNYQRFRFEDAPTTSGTLDASDRDREIAGIYGSFGITPEAVLAPYIYAEFQDIEYQNNSISANRDASEYDFGIGSIFELSPITKFSFDVGRTIRQYDTSAFDDIELTTYAGRVSWSPLEEMSVLLDADRSIQEVAFSGTSAAINTSYRARLNYQVRNNVIFKPYYRSLNRDYQGPAAGEVDTFEIGAGLTYKISPNAWLDINYIYTDQNEKEDISSVDSFERSVYELNLGIQF
jgi:hypothetical protein